MSEYKLYYFNSRGLAEPIRIMLAYAGVPYEDIRFQGDTAQTAKIPDDFKPKCQWGQVPVLENGGKFYCQSSAIIRLLAKRFNMNGANEFENYKCDEINEAFRDVTDAWKPLFYLKDESNKEELLKVAMEKTNTFLARLSDIIKNHGSPGHLVGKSMTWVDILVAYFLDMIGTHLKVDIFGPHEVMKQFVQSVFNEPKIKEWIAKRPQTVM